MIIGALGGMLLSRGRLGASFRARSLVERGMETGDRVAWALQCRREILA